MKHPGILSRTIQHAAKLSLAVTWATVLTHVPTAFGQSGAFTTSGSLGTGNSDALVGLLSTNTYLDAYNLGEAVNLTINGVFFTGVAGGNPGVAGVFSTTGMGNVYGGGGTNPAGVLGSLTNRFVYGGGTTAEVFTFSNLVAGQTYVVSFYNRSWAEPAAANTRVQNLSAGGASAASGVQYDEDAGTSPAQGNLNILRYTFQAATTTQTITFANAVNNYTDHQYGFTLEQTFNNTWTSGATWTASTWSGGAATAPNSAGANANFTAQGAPTTIDLNANRTMGDIQFAGTNAWTISSAGGNTLTLQADVGGAATLSALAGGAHVIAPNITLSSPTLIKLGAGQITLNGNIAVPSGVSTLEVGGGTLTLNGTSNHTGETLMGSGTLEVATVSDYGVASAIGSRALAQENNTLNGVGLHFQGGTLKFTGSAAQSTNRNIRILNGTGGATIDASGTTAAATLSFTHTGANINLFDTGGTRTLNLTGSNTGNNSFSIQLTNQGAAQTTLRKAGTGTWLIANSDNTYTGETIIAGGILNVASVSDYSVGSSIGSRAFADENVAATGIGLHFLGGTLQYTGSTPQSTNRNIRMLNNNGATIDASGSTLGGTLSFTHTGANINFFDTAGTRTLTLTGTNTGNNGFSILLPDQNGLATSLTKTGTGTWVLNGPDANINSGVTTVNNGILALGKTSAIAVNAGLTIGSGANSAVLLLDGTGTGGNQIADATVPLFNGTGASAGILRMNNLAETVGGLSSSGGAGVVENESGTAGTGTLTVSVSGTRTFAGVLRDGDGVGTDGALAFTKTGAGTQVLTGASTHTGATTVSNGTLQVDGSLPAGSAVAVGGTGVLNGAGTFNGVVNINNGGTVSGTGTFTNTVNVGSGGILSGTGTFTGSVVTVGGARISPGSAATPGTLTIAGLTLTTGALVDYEFGGTSDLINVTGAGGLTLNGASFNLFEPGGVNALLTNGNYTLLDYNTSFTGAIANISIANAQPGKFYSLANDTTNTLIVLTVGDATVSRWNAGAGNGLWTTSGNWDVGTPNTAGAVAKFGGLTNVPTTVAVDGAKTVGGIIFDNVNSFTITGGATDTLTLNNGIAAAGITVFQGNHTVAAPVILATDALTSTASGTLLTLSGNITGAKSLTASGTGTTLLTGTNSYTTTNVTGGTLQIGNNSTTGSLGSGDVALANSTTLVFYRSDDLTVANNLSGAGAQVTKRGAGTLTLTGNNAFATAAGGSFNVNQGIVLLGSATAVPSGLVLSMGGGLLDMNGFNVSVSALSATSGLITDNSVGGSGTLTVTQATDTTYAGSIFDGAARTLAVTKNGAGSLTLAGGNTFSQPLTITNGAIIAAGVGSVPISPANVTLGDGSNHVFLIAGAGANDQQFGASTVITFNDGAKNAKLIVRSTNQTVAGVDSSLPFQTTLSLIENDEAGAPGTVSSGTGTLTINAATDHSFTGLIRSQVGTLHLVKEGVGTQEIKNALVGPDNFGTVTVNNGRFLINLTTNANGTNTLNAGSVVLGANGTLGLDGGWVLSRAISGSGAAAGAVVKQGTGAITLSGLNTFTGLTTLLNGTLTAAAVGGTALPGHVLIGNGSAANIFLVMGAANQFGPNSVLTFNNGTGSNAKMELRGFAQTVAGLQSDADDTLSIIQNQETGAPAATTLTINNSADFIFNGLIRTQVGGVLSLVKNGAGTQEIRNIPAQADNFGTLTVNQGKFTVNFSGATGTLGAGTTVALASLSTLGLDGNWTMNRVISGAGNVVKQGAGTVLLTASNSYSGGTSVTGGILNVNADAALGDAAGGVALSAGGTLQAGTTISTNRAFTLGTGGGAIDTNGNTVFLTAPSSVTGTSLTKAGNGILNIAGAQTYAALTTTGGTTNITTTLGTGTSTVTANAALNFTVSQTLASLTIGDGVEVTFGDGLPFTGEPEKFGAPALVPEPGALALLLTGALGLLSRRRTKAAS